ncbi:MAG: zf-HC2 domain-containing protein [Desulfomonile tiedjei]|nr:zf-HC2 domain-containing protein [Desulfomonile tiedjei]
MKTIPCAKATDLIVRELDEGLDSLDKHALESHVRGCTHCQEWREETAGILASIAADVPEDPGEQFWKYYDSSLQARLREIEPKNSWGFFWKAFGAVALAGTVFAVIWLAEFDPSTNRLDQSGTNMAEALFQELEELYGPVADENLTSTLVHDYKVAFSDLKIPQSDEEIPGWFEVEDELHQLL